jgi:hypothetical protein
LTTVAVVVTNLCIILALRKLVTVCPKAERTLRNEHSRDGDHEARRTSGGGGPTIATGELRQRLKFRGVTITDALEAGAIAAFGTPAQCGVLAARAGMDVLLCSARDVSEGQDTVAALADALGHHALDPGHFQVALRRVLALRDSLA